MRWKNIDNTWYRLLLRGEFGIEKESLRVDAQGYLAATSHPDISDSRISRDFSESQVEFISGVYDSLSEACDEICSLQAAVSGAIADRAVGREYMWTYSNPPLYHEEGNIRIAEFEGEKESKTTYREYLAEKYGKSKMLFSGVHLNYSMPTEFFDFLFAQLDGENKTDARSEWYVRLADVLMSDSWLIVALTSASPVAEEFFLRELHVPKEEWDGYASFRNSAYGYWNLFTPELSYRDFSSYLRSIERYVADGAVSSIQELYYPIRLKPRGENTLENLSKNGVNHVELRMLDLNPMCCAGVAKRDLIFIHLLIAYRTAELLSGDREFGGMFTSDSERVALHKQAARFAFWEEQKECKKYACELIGKMRSFYQAYVEDEKNDIPKDYPIFNVLDFEEEKILHPDMRYASQIRKRYGADYIGMRMKEILE